MEFPWRSRPPPGNFCPVCSHSHFPFCTPPPPQYFRPPDQFFRSPLPPPPPQQLTSYDPFVDHQGGTTVVPYATGPPPLAPPQFPHRPWNDDPNYGNDYYRTPNYGFDHDTTGQVGAQRIRLDNASDVASSAEDERRLGLIRDHGAAIRGLDRQFEGGYGKFQGIESGQHIDNDRSLHNQKKNSVLHNHGYGNSPGADGYTNLKRPRGNHEIPVYTERREFNSQFLQSNATQQHRMEAQSAYYGVSNQSGNMRLMQEAQGFKAQPPLPTSPPPPLPAEPPRFRFGEQVASSSAASGPVSMFPIAVDSAPSFHSQYAMASEAKTSVSSHNTSKGYPNSSGFYSEDIQAHRMAPSKTFNRESEYFPPRNHSLEKPKIIDASHILKYPHRANRPDHIVIILRGLPGSGKSYLAKILRDVEVENGGTAPRIHSIDEYFMTEVEKVVESECSRSSSSVRGKKPVAKKVMEYCYEPEMEERSGYEVYILEATYKDPVGCAARNVHSFTQTDILKMADQWEEAPSLYTKLDIKSFLHGDDLEENGIEEVDMDTEDSNHISDASHAEVTNIEKNSRPFEGDLTSDGPSTDEQKGEWKEECPVEAVKDLGKSKWSNDLDDDDVHKTEAIQGNFSAVSSLVKSSKKGKSVRWADQIGRIGFSIGAGKTANVSIVIGPGSGYNLKSNPLGEEEKAKQRFVEESKRRNIFQDQLRAERESFRAAFDKRKQRISGLHLDADDE